MGDETILNRQVPVAAAGGWLSRLTAAIIFIVLATGLVVPKVAGAGFLAIALTGVVWLSLAGGWRTPRLAAHEKLLILAIVLYVAVWLAAWVGHGLHPGGADAVGRVLRLLLVIPAYLFVRRVDGLEPAWWAGLATGAVLAGLYAIGFAVSGQEGAWHGRVGGPTNPVYFGGLVLAFGLMLVPRVGDVRLPAIFRIAAAAAVLMALVASAFSGSRIAWLALPPLLVLYILTLGARQPPGWRFGVPALLATVALIIGLSPLVPISERFIEGAAALPGLIQGRLPAGTLGIRLELWGLAEELIRSHPLLGNGPGIYREALEAAVAAGRLGPEFLEYTEPHSQYLMALIVAGIPGLMALALLLGLPALRFARLWQTGLERTRLLGWCGLTAMTVLATMSLSDSIFERNAGIIWLGIFIAVAGGLVQARRRHALFGEAPVRCHRLSVIMICRNEADRVDTSLGSVAGWADEIVVLDSGSTDGTAEICRRYTDRVEVTDWPGFGRQKQRALARAEGEWVLSLDADEAVSDELRREIDLVLSRPGPHFDGYRLPLSIRAFGGHHQFGHWSRAPLRLFRRAGCRFTDAEVHEKLVFTEPGARAGLLEGPLYHDVYRNLEHAREKLAGYARLQAGERLAAGHRVTPAGPYLRAAVNLIDNYILRAAFLDGRAGWVMARLHARYTLDKYRILRELQRRPDDHG